MLDCGVEGMGDTGLAPVTSSVSCWRASQLRQSPGFLANYSSVTSIDKQAPRPAARTDEPKMAPSSGGIGLMGRYIWTIRATGKAHGHLVANSGGGGRMRWAAGG